MSESKESQIQENISEMDSSSVPSCTTCSDIVLRSDTFQFPSLESFQISELPSLPAFTETSVTWNPHTYVRKLRRKSRQFKPVLARIYENNHEQPVNYNRLRDEKEMRFYSMFDRHHRSDEVIYSDITRRVTHLNKNRHLCDAVFENEINLVRSFLNLGISPNCYDNHKRTPLHIAVSKGHSEMVQVLLDNGADPNMKDGLGNSCLHLAACTNNVEIALILIRGGASVHAVDIRGRSPIQLAQSKLRILQQCPDGFIKSKVKQVIDMLLMYLAKSHEQKDNNGNTSLLTTFQSRLQITDSPEQLSNELDNLSKILNQMESLTIT